MRKLGPGREAYGEQHAGILEGCRRSTAAELDACRYLERRPNEWFTHAQFKAAPGCSDRIIREHLPEALNSGQPALLDIDKSRRAWR